MKADVILRAHGLAKDAVILALVPVPVPVLVLALVLVLVLVRVAIISAQLPVLNLAKDVPDVVDAEILAALDAQTVVRELAKAVVLLDVELLVEVVQVLVQQTVRAIAVERVVTSASDRQQHQYIHFRR